MLELAAKDIWQLNHEGKMADKTRDVFLPKGITCVMKKLLPGPWRGRKDERASNSMSFMATAYW